MHPPRFVVCTDSKSDQTKFWFFFEISDANVFECFAIFLLCKIVKNSTTTNKEPRTVKPRVEGRPYKKLSSDMLQTRRDDIEKKLKVHQAKSTLLQQRLELYLREGVLREVVTAATEE